MYMTIILRRVTVIKNHSKFLNVSSFVSYSISNEIKLYFDINFTMIHFQVFTIKNKQTELINSIRRHLLENTYPVGQRRLTFLGYHNYANILLSNKTEINLSNIHMCSYSPSNTCF